MLNFRLSLNDSQRFLLRNVSIIELGLFINQMSSTVGSMILARVLHDPGKFGEVNLLLQIFGMVGLFLNAGFNSALVYSFSTEADAAKRDKFRFALFGSLVFGVFVSILLAAGAPLLAQAYHLPELRGALFAGSIMLIFNSIINIGIAAFSGNRDFGVQSMFMVMTTVFSTAGTVLGVYIPVGGLLWSVSLWMGFGAAATATIVSIKVHRAHRPEWFGFISLRELWKMLKYGVPIWAGNIAKAFQQPFLVMMIGSGSVVAVGYLTNGLRITGFIGIVTWAFMIVTFPFVAECSQDLREAKRRATICTRYNNFILYPLTLLICLYPAEISGFLFGPEYAAGDSATYIRLLALGVLFSSVSRLGGNILAGIGKTGANFWVMAVAGIGIVAFVPFLAGHAPVLAVWIYTGGWAASAAATILFFYREHFPLDWWKAYGEPLLPTCFMGMLLETGRISGIGVGWLIVPGLIGLTLLTVYYETAPSRRKIFKM
ncbi:MAG TPA: oligosaccharide flippase family protein [Bacilli bacterium]